MEQSGNRPFGRTHRLLIVDDEEVIRDLFGIQLRREGYTVSTAGSAQQALDVLAAERIDLVLLDMNLPDMSGLVLLQKLRETYSILDLPVIIISGAGHRDDIVAGLQSGANDYLTKPIDLGIVRARIQTQLSLHQLKEINDKFSRIAGHDLKKPVILMLDMARQLQQSNARKDLSAEDLDATLSLLIEAGQYMQQLIESLLELRSVHNGRMRLTRLPTDLGAIVRQAVTRNMGYAKSKGIALRMEFTTELPPILADDLRLMQVLDNLIGNAIKFSPAATQITVRTRRENGHILCEVADQGPGIADEDRSKLFVEHARLRNKPTGNETSTGLGLSICREMVTLHGGDTGARNNPGGGTTFWFRLPLPPESADTLIEQKPV
jgi:signal transduction histidine kinase